MGHVGVDVVKYLAGGQFFLSVFLLLLLLLLLSPLFPLVPPGARASSSSGRTSSAGVPDASCCMRRQRPGGRQSLRSSRKRRFFFQSSLPYTRRQLLVNPANRLLCGLLDIVCCKVSELWLSLPTTESAVGLFLTLFSTFRLY